MAKAQSDPPASADHQGRKAPLAHPGRPDQLARRAMPALHRQFASSPVRIAFAAETTKSWPVLFAQVVRSTERSARRLERPQPVYVYVGDLGQCVRFTLAASSRPTVVGFSMTAPPMHALISPLHFVRASAKLDGLQEIYETAGMRTLSHSVAVRSQQASTSEQLALLRRDEDAPRIR